MRLSRVYCSLIFLFSYFLCSLLFACLPQSESVLPRPSRILYVSVEDGTDLTGWHSQHRKALRLLWKRMDATGWRWEEVDTTAPHIDVRVRTFDAHGCEQSGGEYVLGARYVSVDPVCTHGDEELRYAVMHELLHWFTWREFRWAGHLCKRGTEAHNCHPTVRGTGVLSPVMGEAVTDQGVSLSTADARISADDLRLLFVLRHDTVSYSASSSGGNSPSR